MAPHSPPPGLQSLRPPLGLLGAGALILILIAGVLWWANDSAWSPEAACVEQGQVWAEGACQTDTGPTETGPAEAA